MLAFHARWPGQAVCLCGNGHVRPSAFPRAQQKGAAACARAGTINRIWRKRGGKEEEERKGKDGRTKGDFTARISPIRTQSSSLSTSHHNLGPHDKALAAPKLCCFYCPPLSTGISICCTTQGNFERKAPGNSSKPPMLPYSVASVLDNLVAGLEPFRTLLA